MTSKQNPVAFKLNALSPLPRDTGVRGWGPREGSPGGPPGPGSLLRIPAEPLPAFLAATHSPTYPQKLHAQRGQASSLFPPTSLV